MISKVVELEIKRLLRKKKRISQKEIARITGVSEWAVGRVKNGEPVEIQEVMRSKLESSSIKTDDSGEKNRCPVCGGMVYGECRECRLKKMKKNGELVRVYDGSGRPLDLDLSDEEASRLKEIRETMQIRDSTESEREDK